MTNTRLEEALRRVLRTLQPYLRDVIVIGGWVPHLYRRFGNFAEWRSELSGTAEVDVLLPEQLPSMGRNTLGEILTRAGFRSAVAGAVWENQIGTGEKIEFFLPHVGIATHQGTVRPVPHHRGVGAFALTDLDLLREYTNALSMAPWSDARPADELLLRVPTLGAYLVAKASTFLKRTPTTDGATQRRAKDLVYVHDVMAAGDEVMRRVQTDLIDIGRSVMGARRIAHATSQLALLHERHPVLVEAGHEMMERDGVLEPEARSNVLGRIHDLIDMLNDTIGPRDAR